MWANDMKLILLIAIRYQRAKCGSYFFNNLFQSSQITLLEITDDLEHSAMSQATIPIKESLVKLLTIISAIIIQWVMLIIDWFLSFRRVNQKVFLLKIISNASASGGKDESNTTVKHYNAFNWAIHFSPSDKFIIIGKFYNTKNEIYREDTLEIFSLTKYYSQLVFETKDFDRMKKDNWLIFREILSQQQRPAIRLGPMFNQSDILLVWQ